MSLNHPHRKNRAASYAAVAMVALTSLTLSPAGGAYEQSGNQQPARVVIAQPGRTLAAQLRPADTALDVVSSESMPLLVEPPPGKSAAEFYTRTSDVVVLVEVASATARITDDGEFVQTDIQASLVEILKGSPSVSIPQPLHFSLAGGQVSVGGKPVRAVVPWSREVHVGAQYLVFATVDKGSRGLIFGPSAMFEKQGDQFVSLLTKGPPRGRQLAGTSDAVLQSIRARPRRRRRS